ncbi:MAG: hypothetical protein C4554_00570 [Dethiobacter sp.]|jgi:hypothetical protein|nr:MAG: hypothetical protein C4554_00570 [Dethiobacter sp.]
MWPGTVFKDKNYPYWKRSAYDLILAYREKSLLSINQSRPIRYTKENKCTYHTEEARKMPVSIKRKIEISEPVQMAVDLIEGMLAIS